MRIRLESGETRAGTVLEVDRDLAVVQVMEGTHGLDLERHPGRVHRRRAPHPGRRELARQGLERPRGTTRRWAAGAGRSRAPVNGLPINPTRREPPREPVLTGVSAVDALTTLVRGQKLPVFSVAGLPHLELATQIAAHASVGDEPFAVVFAGMGLTHADSAGVQEALEERSAAGRAGAAAQHRRRPGDRAAAHPAASR